MPTDTTTFTPSTFRLLAFDIYGTLIDWETGIITALAPLLLRLPPTHKHHIQNTTTAAQNHFLLMQYITLEASIQRSAPTLPYPQILAQVSTTLATNLGVPPSPSEAASFGASIGTWPPFPDTVAAMTSLGKRFKLVAFTNADNDSFARTRAGPLKDVRFDAVYTAQDIGSYKPDARNFEYLIARAEEMGVRKEEIWTVAVALSHDHVPSREVGLRPGVWIKRNSDEVPVSGNMSTIGDRVRLAGEFGTLGEFAEEVERVWGREET